MEWDDDISMIVARPLEKWRNEWKRRGLISLKSIRLKHQLNPNHDPLDCNQTNYLGLKSKLKPRPKHSKFNWPTIISVNKLTLVCNRLLSHVSLNHMWIIIFMICVTVTSSIQCYFHQTCLPTAILFLCFKWTVGTTCTVCTTDGMLWLAQVSIVMEQMLRLLHDCGLPKEDVDFINSDGKTMNKLLIEVCIYTKFNNHFLFLILLKRSM